MPLRPNPNPSRRPGAGLPILELRGVEARIEGRTILRGVDWTIARGEHWGVVGANGAGKTTLLALVSGQRWPAPGGGSRRYRLSGRWQHDAVEARRCITLVGPELQDYYFKLGWNFSAGAVVITGLHKTEIPRRSASAADHRRAHALLETLDAAHLSDRAFLTLSHGEQRRILIARALAFEPEILLLDEPASGLDQRARAELERTIAHAAMHATIIASAHADAGLPGIIERVVEIDSGTIYTRSRTRQNAPRQPDVDARNTPVPAPTASAPPPLIEIRDADIWLGDRHVLKHIDWRLAQGEHWLVRGDNGAGKSTFLRLLHGQLRPARGGVIRWPGLGAPRDVWALRRRIAWVSPELAASYLYPTTTLGCIASGFTASIGQTRALRDDERGRCEHLLAAFDLERLRDRRLASLSHGQRRRALLARTLATKPRVLLLDEPWEGLDRRTIEKIVGCLRAAMAEGMQLVCASHVGDMGLGTNRELVLVDGEIQERAT